MSTVAKIKTKVRRLTKRPSTTQISEAQLLEYINDFWINDFPQLIQTDDLTGPISFTTTPDVAVYDSTTGDFTLNLKDFTDKIVDLDGPVYLSGQPILLSRSPKEFYAMYPTTKYEDNLGSGDGVTTIFSFTLSTKLVAKTVIIGTLLATNEAVTVYDEPVVDTYGRASVTGLLYDMNENIVGDINYLTGVANVTYPTAPGDGKTITYEAEVYQSSRPDTMLFYNGEFTLRPIPDKVYEVKFQARVQPDEFTLDTDSPTVKQWWQYIAYGTAKKILEDLGDMEAVERIMPEFMNQQEQVNAKTNLQYEKESTSTIYDRNPYPRIPYPWRING